MNTFRSMALALVACAGVLSVTACTAGVTMASTAGGTAVIMFTGHGFKGEVAAVTDFTAAPGSPGGSVTGLPKKNVTSIDLFSQ